MGTPDFQVQTPLALMEWAIGHRPAAIVCDIDGTLAEIAPTPGEARLAPGARDALSRLIGLVDVVAVVSGRSAPDASLMIDLSGVLVIGNHGFEWLSNGERIVDPSVQSAIPDVATALSDIASQIALEPVLTGTIVENKELSGSIHYRQTAHHELSRSRLLDLASAEANRYGLKVTEGRMVIELRPAIEINKGVALRHIIERKRLNGMVFLGDDVTDIDGFRALTSMRNEVGFAGASIAVSDPEAKSEVIEAADASVSGVPACIELLETLADRLSNGSSR
jgi:trehalose 6-phosphate phosphatase